MKVLAGIDRLEMNQLDEWLVEHLHLAVEERMAEQKPIGNTQPYQCGTKTTGCE